MKPPDDSPEQELTQAVAAAADDAEFLAALADLYRQVDQVVAARDPRCRACGDCCKFDQAPHRLYVSTGELALLTAGPAPEPCGPLRCPYQVEAHCHARGRRPLGCRLFFCDCRLRTWSEESYEARHQQIRRLHELHDIGYHYVEMTTAAKKVLNLPERADVSTSSSEHRSSP